MEDYMGLDVSMKETAVLIRLTQISTEGSEMATTAVKKGPSETVPKGPARTGTRGVRTITGTNVQGGRDGRDAGRQQVPTERVPQGSDHGPVRRGNRRYHRKADGAVHRTQPEGPERSWWSFIDFNKAHLPY
jgi:hypothetical protein